MRDFFCFAVQVYPSILCYNMGMRTERKFFHSSKSFYFLVILLCVLPEAIFLSRHGFYWDDWSQLFLHAKFGDGEFWNYFSYNRPGSAWTHVLFFPLCGSSPIRWHILFLLLKTALTFLFLRIAGKIIPAETALVNTAAVLFAVCPLFSQEYISIAYSQHYTDFVLFFLSVLSLLNAAEAKDKGRTAAWYLLSVISMVLHLMISEYFAFLEVLKLPLLYFCLRQKNQKQTIRRALLFSLPHYLLFAAYCFYRLNITMFIPRFSAETPDLLYLLRENFAAGVISLCRNIAVDMLWPFTGFIARLLDVDLLHLLSAHELGTVLFSLILAAAVFLLMPKHDSLHENSRLLIFVILLGITGMALGILPFWVMNENYLVTDDPYHADRCFLAALPFVCLIFSAILLRVFPEGKRLRGASAFFVFLFVRGQLAANRTAELYTQKQNRFYNQLTERVPGIKDGTAVIDDTIIFPEQGNFSTASALNVLYENPIRENGDVPVWIFGYDTRKYEEHGGFHVQNRNYHFSEPPENYIYIDHDNRFANCTWVFGPEDTDNPHVSDLQRGWIRHSDPGRILTDAVPSRDRNIFGNFEDGWCKYYEQAALLRQKEDWAGISELAHHVMAVGFTPEHNSSNSPFEWWPFIEGLYRNGETETALSLAEDAVRQDSAYSDFFAGRLEKLGSQNSVR